MKSPSAQFSRFAMPATLTVKRTMDVVLNLLTETNTTGMEFTSSTILLYVGVLLALPNEALTPTIPLFHTMTSFLPESAWAALFLLFGAFQSMANLSRSRKLRVYAAFCTAGLFGFIGILGASVHPPSLLGAFCKVLAASDIIVYWALGVSGEK